MRNITQGEIRVVKDILLLFERQVSNTLLLEVRTFGMLLWPQYLILSCVFVLSPNAKLSTLSMLPPWLI